MRGEYREYRPPQIDIDNVLAQIENKEIGEQVPSLHFDTFGKKQLVELVEKLKGGEKQIVSIIRCWNKGDVEITEILKKLEEMKKHMPELGGVFFSINAEGDVEDEQGKGTRERINILAEQQDLDVAIIPVDIHNYSWTAGLNGPAALLHNIAQQQGIAESNISVLNQSFDVHFDQHTLEEVSQRIQEGRPIVTSRSDELGAEHEEKEGARLALDLVKQQFESEEIDNTLEEQKKILSLGRNTGMLLSLEDISMLGGFNRDTNEMGGMEDHEFGARLLVYTFRMAKKEKEAGNTAEGAKWMRKAIELMKAMKRPVHYSDSAWEKHTGKEAKLEREKKALKTIIDNVTQRFASNTEPESAVLEKTQQDFNFG